MLGQWKGLGLVFQRSRLWNFAGSALAMAGFVLFFLPLGAILLQTSFFRSLVKPVPQFKGFTGKSWWIGAILTVLIPVGSLFYMHTVTSKIIPASGFWPMSRVNGIMGWALFVAIVTIILILVNHYVLKGDRNATTNNYGLTDEDGKIEWRNIGKSLLLAFSLFGIGYLVLVLVYRWLLVDFRIFEVQFKLLTPARFRIVLQYLIPWMLAYIVVGANLHGLMRTKDGSKSIGREILVNILLLTMVLSVVAHILWSVVCRIPGVLCGWDDALLAVGVPSYIGYCCCYINILLPQDRACLRRRFSECTPCRVDNGCRQHRFSILI